MKTAMKQRQTKKVNLPELKNPISSSVKEGASNGTQPCLIIGWLPPYFR